MVEIEQPTISANKSDVHQPHISQKPLSIHSSNESTDSDTESASSSPTGFNSAKTKPETEAPS